MELADRVRRTVRKYAMVRKGGRVLVALSGGPDSVALTLLLRDLESRGELHVVGLAHLNHALRPAACDDEVFCRAFADELGVPFLAEIVDVRDVARRRRLSLEDAGRKVRYAFLERAASAGNADVIATGHTADDQAETFLLRLLRGSGPRGLAGIFPVAGRVVRPLLEIRREELRAYLAARGQPSREDESNRDLSFPRNRVRHELIPYLQRELSPGVVDVLAREAEIAREDEDWLYRKAIESADKIVLREDAASTGSPDPRNRRLTLDAPALRSLHAAVASRVARHALALASERFIGFEDVRRLLDFVGEPGRRGELALPGCRAVYRGDRVELRAEQPRPFSNPFRFPLSIPGEVTLDSQGWAVSAQLASDADRLTSENRVPSSAASVLVEAAPLVLPLWVRSRQPGDRFRPPGLGGRRKKLQDFLVDRKIPRNARDLLPLVVDSQDRIVWIVGQSVSEDFRATAPSPGVILLKARRLGGEG